MINLRTNKNHFPTQSKSEFEAIKNMFAKFPSFQFFYNSEAKTMLDAANSILILDHLIHGTKEDYRELIRLQKSNALSLKSFNDLYNFLYPFNLNPELLHQLELFIYLDSVSRTETGRKLTANLPYGQRDPANHDLLAITIINKELLAETRTLNFRDTINLRRAFYYRQFITGKAPGHVSEFDDDIMRIAQAGVICDIAGLSADYRNLGASRVLTESMASQLITCIKKRYSPEKARELCSLTID